MDEHPLFPDGAPGEERPTRLSDSAERGELLERLLLYPPFYQARGERHTRVVLSVAAAIRYSEQQLDQPRVIGWAASIGRRHSGNPL